MPRPTLTDSSASRIGFSCHKGELPLLYVFAFLAISELILVHWLVSAWSMRVGFFLSTATVILLAATGYFGLRAILRPITLAEEAILIPWGRAGMVLAYDNLSEVCFIAFSPEPKSRSTYRRTALAHPNFLLRLRNPITHRTMIRTRTFDGICIRVDDPAAFGAALQSRLGWGRQRGAAQAGRVTAF